jgi:phosphonate degradation associated HDIG domain protein
MGLTIGDIEKLFHDHGHIAYSGEGVSQLEHALQCAQLAEAEHASPELATAALLHDLGHMLNLQGASPTVRGIDDMHQYFAVPFIRGIFPAAVVEPIKMHVDAKRALCAMEPAYYEGLSEDSKRSLKLQGGIFSAEQLETFLAKPFAEDALRLRRWDDRAKVAGASTPPIGHYLEVAASAAAR